MKIQWKLWRTRRTRRTRPVLYGIMLQPTTCNDHHFILSPRNPAKVDKFPSNFPGSIPSSPLPLANGILKMTVLRCHSAGPLQPARLEVGCGWSWLERMPWRLPVAKHQSADANGWQIGMGARCGSMGRHWGDDQKLGVISWDRRWYD